MSQTKENIEQELQQIGKKQAQLLKDLQGAVDNFKNQQAEASNLQTQLMSAFQELADNLNSEMDLLEVKRVKLYEELQEREDISTPQYEKIKTYKDACFNQETNFRKITDFDFLPESQRVSAYANHRLETIYKAIVKKWRPDFSNELQKGHIPFFIWTKEASGFVFAMSRYGSWNSYSGIGAQFCFPNDEMAKFFGTQFIDDIRELMQR